MFSTAKRVLQFFIFILQPFYHYLGLTQIKIHIGKVIPISDTQSATFRGPEHKASIKCVSRIFGIMLRHVWGKTLSTAVGCDWLMMIMMILIIKTNTDRYCIVHISRSRSKLEILGNPFPREASEWQGRLLNSERVILWWGHSCSEHIPPAVPSLPSSPPESPPSWHTSFY